MRKVLALILIFMAIFNIILFAKQLISALTFWVIIAIIAAFAYYVVPQIKA